MESINTLDIVIVAVMGLSAVIGLYRGLVRELLSLAAWVGAGWAAIAFHDPVKRLLERWIDEPQWAGIVAGAGLFLIVLVALMILAGYLSGGVKRASLLAPANRMLGVIFGLLRGGVVVALVYIALVNVFDDHADDPQVDGRADQLREQPKWLETSRLMPHVRRAATVIEGLVPQDMLPAGIRKRQDSPEETGTL